MKQLTIAFPTTEFVTEPYFAGGLANYLDRITQILKAAGHRPEVFVVSDRDELLDHHGVPVRRVRRQRDRYPLEALRHRRSVSGILRPAGAIRDALRARQAEGPIDLIQYPSYESLGYFRLKETPAAVRVSSVLELWDAANGHSAGAGRRAAYSIELEAMRRADLVFGPSAAINAHLAQVIGELPMVAPSPWMESTGGENHKVLDDSIGAAPYLLFFGVLARLKGLDVLAKALPQILAGAPRHRLVLAGHNQTLDGEDSMSHVWRAAGAERGRVQWLGALPRATLAPIIRRASAVLLPSRIDNMPNTGIEALSLGTPVVASQATGLDLVIRDGENGFITPTGDSGALAEAALAALARFDPDGVGASHDFSGSLSPLKPAAALAELLAAYREAMSRHAS